MHINGGHLRYNNIILAGDNRVKTNSQCLLFFLSFSFFAFNVGFAR